jgi:hypothetical protein
LFTLIDVKPNESFTDETVVYETIVRVFHKLILLPSGNTRITCSTEIVGPAAADVGPMVTADFDDVLVALRRFAETP